MFKHMKASAWLTMIILTIIILSLSGCGEVKTGSGNNSGEIVKIGIGYQAPTAQTWGALIIKNQKLYEKYLEEKYPDKQFVIEWFNSPSGPPLTNNMIAGKLQMSFMGDMPLLINGEKGQTMRNYKSVFIAFDGKGLGGKNQAIMIPKGSGVTMQSLEGKTVSTVLGSSAHRMLLAALDKYELTDKVSIVNQDVTVGMTNIEQNKIAAHSTWEPYPSLIRHKEVGDLLLDGSETEVDYLDGVVADRVWAENNKEYVIAFLKALIEAHQFVINNPEEAARLFAEESGYPVEVTKKIVKNVRFDAAIYQKDLKTLEGSSEFLKKLGKIQKVDLGQFVDDGYLKEAAKAMQVNYPQVTGEWSEVTKL